MPAKNVAAVAAEPGAATAAPLVIGGQSARIGTDERALVLIGAVPGQLGSTDVSSGSTIRRAGDAVVDGRLGVGIGRRITIAGVGLTVVGTVSNRTMFAGQPDVYVSLRDAQRILFGGRPLINAVITTGKPGVVPRGLAAYSNEQIERASLDQMSSAVSSISNTRIFMWSIAAFIVAALVYVSTLERRRDFAVLKALGSSSGILFAGLVLQAVIVALTAAAIAAAISTFMTGLFAQRVEIPGSAFVVLPVIALAVGILASLVALRHAVGADPATAFAG
jgi:putative ABC transport system permease protein